jgi:nitroreductase
VQAIKSRRSIRGYKSVPVPKETLAQILEIASYAPSANNSQPWEFIVLGGEVLDELKRTLEEKSASRAPPHPDFELGFTEADRWSWQRAYSSLWISQELIGKGESNGC